MMYWRADLMQRNVREGMCEIDKVDPSAVAGALEALPPDKVLQRTAEALKTLAHPNRLRIVKALQGRELCVCDLSQITGLSMSGTSQQLRDLNRLGAVEYRTAGKFAYYSISDPYWLQIAESVIMRFDDADPAAVSPVGKRRESE